MTANTRHPPVPPSTGDAGASACAVYRPRLTRATVQSGAHNPGGYSYNHAASLARFDGRWWVLWSANTTQTEQQPGQVILQKSAADFAALGEATAVRCFADPAHTDNPVAVTPTGVQWQPGTAVVGGALWCVWHQQGVNAGVYFSKLTSASAKWTTVRVPVLPYTRAGVTYQIGFVAGDLLQLASGRVLVPIALVSTTSRAAALPRGQNSGDLRDKLVGVIYTDDQGATWRIGGMVGIQGEAWAAFEPSLTVLPDGTVRMFARSFSTGEVSTHDQFLSTASRDDGATFAPLVSTGLATVSSRSTILTRKPTEGPRVMLMNDQRRLGPDSNVALDRRNLSVYLGDVAGDFIPGTPLSDDNVDVGACYASGVADAGKLYVVYSTFEQASGFASTIKSVVADPAPSARGSILLRGNARPLMSPALVTEPARAFDYRPWSVMRSTATLAGADPEAQSFVILFKASVRGPTGVLLDTRSDDPATSGVQIRAGATLLVGVQRSGYFSEKPTTLAIPVDEEVMVFGAVVRTAGQVTVGLVRKDGSVSTQTLQFGPLGPINGATVASLGCAKAGSAGVAGAGGTTLVRRIAIFDGALTLAQFRAVQHADGAAFGMAPWPGETAPSPDARIDLDASDPAAGANTRSWTSRFTPLGQREGLADTIAEGSRPWVRLRGCGSAAISPGVGPLPNHYAFSYKAAAGRTAETGICTIGADNAALVLAKMPDGAIRLKINPSSSKEVVTLAAPGRVADGVGRRVEIVFGLDRVTLIHQGLAPVTVRFLGRPLVFLGDAWGVATSSDANLMLFDTGAVTVRAAELEHSAFALTDLPTHRPAGRSS